MNQIPGDNIHNDNKDLIASKQRIHDMIKTSYDLENEPQLENINPIIRD